MTRHELSKISGRAKRGLASKTWMGGVRPMQRMTAEWYVYCAETMTKHTGPGRTNDGKFAGYVPVPMRPSFETKRRAKRHGRGLKTDTGHVPEHAKASMAKRKLERKTEYERVKKFKASRDG